ncbi:hypothetical protein EV356DRAFT_520989 [Viridothelium virens]|uniref:Secreted protein n=1 Tax=Viridothelium virens TaxID=1048519 RepID=A0A6A6GVD1_VIRVR|nr:hypothetical protein EV356DRAFT_520989 [Viridothelium virens]
MLHFLFHGVLCADANASLWCCGAAMDQPRHFRLPGCCSSPDLRQGTTGQGYRCLLRPAPTAIGVAGYLGIRFALQVLQVLDRLLGAAHNGDLYFSTFKVQLATLPLLLPPPVKPIGKDPTSVRSSQSVRVQLNCDTYVFYRPEDHAAKVK